MRDSLHSYMKVGIVHCMAFPDVSAGAELVISIKKIVEDEFFGSIERMIGSNTPLTHKRGNHRYR